MTIIVVSKYERFLTFAKKAIKGNDSSVFNLINATLTVGPLKFVWIPPHNVARAYSLEASGVMFIEDDTWARLPMIELGELCRRIREYNYDAADET